MRLPIDKLDWKLQAKGAQLARIIENTLLLEDDMFLMQTEEFSIRFCVDFHDLRAYLALEPGGPSPSDEDRSPEEYARVLLFNRLVDPIILLPVYYIEFREHVARFFGSKRESIDERKKWSRDLTFQIRRVMEKAEVFAGFLESHSGEDREKVFREAERFAVDVIRSVKSTISRMQDVQKAGGLLGRFDALVQGKRLEGLRSAVPGQAVIEVEKGSVYLFSRKYLDDRRPRSVANETDALALSMIHWLNQNQDSRRQRFYLVSGAGVMHDLVRKVNEVVLQRSEDHIELRDLEYWKLWFAISGKSSSPELERVREFKRSVWQELDGLAKRNDQLRMEFSQAVQQGDGRTIEYRAIEVEKYLSGLDSFIEKMLEPLKGGGWSLLMLEDILMPLRRDEGGLEGVLGRLKSIVEDLDKEDQDIDALKRVLRGLLQELERLIWIFEGEAAGDRQKLPHQEREFCSGWTLRTSDWRRNYRGLLGKIDTHDRECLGDVFQELSRLTLEEPAAFERYIVAARAYLESDLVDAAEQEIGFVDPIHHDDSEFLVTKALLDERRGRFDEAQRIFEDLLLRHDEPVIRIHLAWLLRRKYSLTKDREFLDAATLQGEMAKESVRGAAVGIRIEATALYLDIICDVADAMGDATAVRAGLHEIDELSEELEKKGVVDGFKVSLRRVRRRVRRTLGLAHFSMKEKAEEGGK